MPISFACDTCGKPFSVKDELAEKKIKCGNCGSVLAVPAGSEPGVDEPAAEPDDDVEESSDDLAAPPSPSSDDDADEERFCHVCGTKAGPKQSICIGCGTNIETGEQPAPDESVPAGGIDQVRVVLKELPRTQLIIVSVLLVGGLVAGAGYFYVSSKYDDWAFDEGVRLEEAGAADQALAKYQEAIRYDETHVPALRAIARLARAKGDDRLLADMARRILLIATDPELLAWAHTLQARSYLAAGALPQADRSVEAAEEKGSDLVDILDVRGQIAYARLEGAAEDTDIEALREKAYDALGKAVDRQSTDPETYLKLGMLTLDWREDPTGAEQLFQQAADLGASEAFILLAETAMKQKDWETAEKRLRGAIEADGSNHRAHFLLAKVLLASQGPEQAKPSSESAVGLDPEKYDYRLLLGDIHAALGQQKEAVAEYDEASRIKANKAAEPLLKKAKLQLKLGDTKEALRSLEQAVRAEPEGGEKNVDTLFMIAEIYADSGDTSNLRKAESTYKSILEKGPNDTRALVALGRLLLERKKDVKAALQYFKRAVAADKKALAAWAGLADCYAELRDLKAAVQAYDQAIKADPDNQEVVEKLYYFAKKQRCWHVAFEKIDEILQAKKAAGEKIPSDLQDEWNTASVQRARQPKDQDPCLK